MSHRATKTAGFAITHALPGTPAELSLGFGVYDGRRLFAEERERFIF
jgi:hypothetical protein